MIRPIAALCLCALLTVAACGAAPSGWLGGADPQVTAALQSAVTDSRARAFYERRGWRPAWENGRDNQLLEAFADAERHGLDARRFLDMEQAAQDPMKREAALTVAALSYAQALATGAVDPDEVYGIYTVERPGVDIVGGLSAAADRGNVKRWLAELAPDDAEYRALSDAYLQAVRSAGPVIADGPPIKPGDRDPRVVQIAEALEAAGYLDPPMFRLRRDVMGEDVVAALKAFQTANGVESDGIAGPATLAILTSDPSGKARQLAINLERRRWLARDAAPTRIDVNTAAATMEYLRGGRVVWANRVVVGRRDTPTPALGSPMFQLVVNPPWNVPQKIAENEILPKGEAYLQKAGMYVTDGRVVQRPGPKAALGQVKFDMRNNYAIYLHDTPSKALFGKDRRHASHGCVRVKDALAFARLLAAEQGDGAEFDRKLASGDTAVVELDREIPVRLLYHTAYLGPDGKIVFTADPYGWDDKLAGALGMKGSRRRGTEESSVVTLGP